MQDWMEQFIATVDTLHVSAMLIDRQGRVVHANPRLAELTGRARDELIGCSQEDLCRQSISK